MKDAVLDAQCEDRTRDLEIMRLTRYRLRQPSMPSSSSASASSNTKTQTNDDDDDEMNSLALTGNRTRTTSLATTYSNH